MYDLDESQSCGDLNIDKFTVLEMGKENRYSGSENSEAADKFRLAGCHFSVQAPTLVHEPTSQSDFYSSGAARKYDTEPE